METYPSCFPWAGSAVALHGLGEFPCHTDVAPGPAAALPAMPELPALSLSPCAAVTLLPTV